MYELLAGEAAVGAGLQRNKSGVGSDYGKHRACVGAVGMRATGYKAPAVRLEAGVRRSADAREQAVTGTATV